MIRKKEFSVIAAAIGAAVFYAAPAGADDQVKSLYEKVSPSLVAVQFTYAGETQQRDFIVPGIVVSDTGLVMIPINLVGRIPDEQLVKFKIIVPRRDRDNDEVEAIFQGRDERGEVAFVKAGKAKADAKPAPVKQDKGDKTDDAEKTDGDKMDGDKAADALKGDDQGDGEKKPAVKKKSKPAGDDGIDGDKKPAEVKPEPVIKWVPLEFADQPSQVGDTVYSVGMQPKSGGYHTFVTRSMVSSLLRGPVKGVMVSEGGLGSSFAPVLNGDGKAIGLVSAAETLLDDTKQGDQATEQARFVAELTTNKNFRPTSDFAVALADPPTPGHPVPLAFTGLLGMTGLGKNDAAMFGIESQVAVQVTDVLAGSAADKAGLKSKQIIVKYDGQPLERGDVPDEAVGILDRKLLRRKPGDVVTLTVLDGKGKPPRDVKLTLEAFPKRDIAAARYYTEEIGFGVREMVPLDRPLLKLKKDEKEGVLVTVLKTGGTAENAGLRPGDMITKINDDPVSSLEVFKQSFEEFRKDHEHEAIVLKVRHPNGSEDSVRIEPPQQ